MTDLRIHLGADIAATVAGVAGAAVAAADGTISVPISALVSGAVVLAGAIWALAIILVKVASHIATLTEKVAQIEAEQKADHDRQIEDGREIATIKGRLEHEE